jgi:drug/metabolite transporter (DMT)-like permease
MDPVCHQRGIVMKPMQILGAVLFAVGVVLLIFALRASDAPAEQVVEAMTGSYTDRTMQYLIGGIAAAVGGALLFLFGKRGK